MSERGEGSSGGRRGGRGGGQGRHLTLSNMIVELEAMLEMQMKAKQS